MDSETPAEKPAITDIQRIMEMIPHRYPMLLVDRVLKMELGEYALGLKNVTINEPHFQGHFPAQAVMPGVLIIESMAQTSGLLVVKTMGADAEGKLVYFMSIDGARFRRPVVPGDAMMIHCQRIQRRGNVWKFACEVKVDDALVAEAKISAMIMDK